MSVDVPTAYRYSVTTTNSLCDETTAYGFIVVNPNEEINLTSAPVIVNVCQNDPITPIEFEFSGTGAVNIISPTIFLPDGLSGATSNITTQTITVEVTGTGGPAGEEYYIILEGRSYRYVTANSK